MPKFSFIPREGKFFVLFDESAKNAAEVAVRFRAMLDNWANMEKSVDEIKEDLDFDQY